MKAVGSGPYVFRLQAGRDPPVLRQLDECVMCTARGRHRRVTWAHQRLCATIPRGVIG